MSNGRRLIIFDVDGTLVDSQEDILTAMRPSFETFGHPVPRRDAVLSIVGLTLEMGIARLTPELSASDHSTLANGYRAAYHQRRVGGDPLRSAPLYPHADAVLRALHAREDTLLGVATGKSRRGLRALIESHGLDGLFVTLQTADDHPSKPHPAMLLAALAETGVAPKDAVMVGDTSYGMEMARAAGMPGIGVTWGYHAPAALLAATSLVNDFRDLEAALNRQDRPEKVAG